MGLRLGYSLRETGSNLTRNLTLALASIVTIAVSLALVGASLNLRQGVQNATVQWNSGVQLIVFMKPEATEEQVVAVGKILAARPEVDASKLRRVDKKAAFEEIKIQYADSPEIIQSFGGPDGAPESWRVVPKKVDATVLKTLGQILRKSPGVFKVSSRSDAVERFKNFTHYLLLVFVVAAIALLASAVLLILNTIRLAMFARRREIEVMKLVGATNWFIRVPFMLEGLVQGVFGAVLGWAASWGINHALRNSLKSGGGNGTHDLLESLAVGAGQVRSTGLWLLVIGALVSTIGSGVAVTRFLDV